MTTNRLAKSAVPAFEMTAAKARQWAQFAREKGDHAKAVAWANHAAELEANEAAQRPIDGKMRGAGA